MKICFLTSLLLFSFTKLFSQRDSIVYNPDKYPFPTEFGGAIVYFPFDKFSLTTEARSTLDIFFSKSLDKKMKLSIEGYCDAKGTDAYNDILSEKRVATVKNYLLEKGIDPSIIVLTKGYGEKESMNGNRTEAERQLNRRVTLSWHLEQTTTSTQVIETPKETVTLTEKIDVVKEGENIRLQNINFYGGRHVFLPQSMAPLQELLEVMKSHPSLVIEIQGHICCFRGEEDGVDMDTNERKLSVNRARAVYDYLIENGIAKERMTYKGYAGTKRLVEEELDETDRTLNRRVEIMIVKK